MQSETVMPILLGLKPTAKKMKTPGKILAKKVKIMRSAKTISEAKYMLRILEGMV